MNLTVAQRHSKLLPLIKAWAKLELDQKLLDYQRGKLVHQMRELFPDGKPGDQMFVNWAVNDLPGLTAAQAWNLLSDDLAMYRAIPDETQYLALGGKRAAKALIRFSKTEQLAIIGETKAGNYSLLTIVQRREKANTPAKVAAKREPAIAPKISQAHRDAATLAKYIARLSGPLPLDVAELIDLYAPGARKVVPSVTRRKAAA